jgi:hypothetical protein
VLPLMIAALGADPGADRNLDRRWERTPLT